MDALFCWLLNAVIVVRVVLHIYWIAFYCCVCEWFNDRNGKAKLILFMNRWQKYVEEGSLLERQENSLYRNVAVVTGGDGTIGAEIVKMLHALHFRIITVGLHKPTHLANDDIFMECDLSKADQIRQCVLRITQSADHIDVFIANAGIMLANYDDQSRPEPHLLVNVLSHAILFHGLQNLLESSEWSHPKAIFVSSSTCRAGSAAEYLDNENWHHQLSGYKSYADSKLLISLYAVHLADKLRAQNSRVQVASVHPGVVPGALYRHVFPPIRFFIIVLLAPFVRSSELAALDVTGLVFSEANPDGMYFETGRRYNFRCDLDQKVLKSIGELIDSKL